MRELGRNPARIIPAWQQYLESHCAGGRPLRGIGEPIWAGRGLDELRECQLHEALLNVAVDPRTPFWLVCPYDTSRLDPAVIDEAHRSHPVIVEADSYRGSVGYAGRAHVDSMFAAALPTLAEEPTVISFTASDIGRLFALVALKLYVAGIPADKSADVAAAAQQLAESSVQRGAGHGTVRIWQQPNAIVCEVADVPCWPIRWPGAERLGPASPMPLWFANQLCDLVQLRSAEFGTTVRVHTWR